MDALAIDMRLAAARDTVEVGTLEGDLALACLRIKELEGTKGIAITLVGKLDSLRKLETVEAEREFWGTFEALRRNLREL